MTRLFDLDMQLVHDTLLMALSVGALFLALSYLLFDPVRALLADRQQRIAQELEGAKAQMEEARRQPPGRITAAPLMWPARERSPWM